MLNCRILVLNCKKGYEVNFVLLIMTINLK